MSDSDLEASAAEVAAPDTRLDEDDRLKPEFVRAVIERVDAGDAEGARALIEPLHPADLADLFELVDYDDRRALAAALADLLDGDVLAEMNEHVREELLDALDPHQVAEIAGELETDDAVAIIEDMEEEEQRAVLRALDPDDRAAIEEALSHPEESAGRIMRRDLVCVPEHWTVGRVIDWLRAGEDLPTDFFEIYVVDPAHRPVGTCLLSWILRAPRPVAVADVDEGVARLVAEISLAKPYHSALIYSGGEDLKAAQRFRRAAPDPAPPTVLAAARTAEVSRFEALSAGFTAVLELPFDKRLLFNVLHSVSAGDEMRDGVVRLQDYARRGGAARKLRVLVADDTPTNREVIGTILERGGHSVTRANDGEQALDALERERPDIVLLDRNMPNLGGMETLQAIRLITRGRERLPVLMLSADVTPEVKREALEAGFDAFLPKPIEALRLLEEIQTLAGKPQDTRRPEPAPAPAPRVVVELSQHAPVVNAETLGHLEELGSSPAFVEKLVGVFLADNNTLIGRVEQALAARDYKEFRSHLHALKGSSASMGTDRLTTLCASLGKLSDSEMRLQAPRVLRSLNEELAAARGELERYVVEMKKSTG